MKKLGLLLTIGVVSLGFSGNVNAYNIDSADYYSWSTTSSRVYTLDPDYWALNTADTEGGIGRYGTFNGAGLNYLHLCPAGTIPANTLATFTITARLSGKYATVPLTSSDSRVGILNASYGEYGVSTYTFYTDSNISDCIDFGVGKNYEGSTLYWNGAVSFYVSRMSGVTISNSGGGSGGSYDTQLNQIRYLQQDQYNRLVDILSNLSQIKNGQVTVTDITNAVEQAQESEKDQVQDASDEGETAANEAGETAEEDTATITETVGDVFEAFETEATDCVIPLNLGHGVNAGSLNLCSEVPQTVRNLIGYVSTAIVALVVVRLLHTIINTYLEFIESFQR